MASSCLRAPSSPASHRLNRCILILLLGTFGVLATPVVAPVENLRVTGLPSTTADTDVGRFKSRNVGRDLEETPTPTSAECIHPPEVICQSTIYERPVADADGNASFACETPNATLSQAAAETIGSGEGLAKRFLSPPQEGYPAGSSATSLLLLPHERTTRDDRSTLVGHPLLPAFYLASSLLFALGFFILLYRRKAPAALTVRLNISVTVRDHGYVKSCHFPPEF